MGYDTYEHQKLLIDLLVRAGDAGLTSGELATRIGVTPQTVRNHIDRLGERGVPIFEEKRRYFIADDYQSVPLSLTLPQAWMFYLPLRRMVRLNLNRYRLVHDLLYGLASHLHPALADAIIPDQPEDVQEIDRIFPQLVEGWHSHRMVNVRYQSPDRTYPSNLVVAPLWFEPAVWSDSQYLIAGFMQSDNTYQIQALKIDRIQSVEITRERFDPPPTVELLQGIETAWGIWGGTGVEVTLRFHYRVRTRLLETRWHPSQRITTGEDGYLSWQAVIAEPQEMLPWIRGWGADVEVLAPADLRERLTVEAERMARMYGRCGDTKRRLL